MADEQMAVDAVDSPEPVGSEPSVVDTTDAGVAEASESEPFFRWKGDDEEEERIFRKPAEVADFIRNTGMTRKQYEAEVAKVRERAKRVEEMEQKYQTQETVANQLAAKYEPIDALMKQNPQFEQAVQQLYDRLVKGGRGGGRSDPKDLIRQIAKEELKPFEEFKSEYEKEKEARKAQEVRQRAISRMRESDPHFDESLVERYLKGYEEYPPEEQQYAALRVAWDAVRGSMSAAELERRAAESNAKRRPPNLTSTPGTKNAEIDVSKMTEQEMREAALKEIGG